MKKIVSCALIALIVLALFNPAALAAKKNGIEYSGESYYAVVREGVVMRDKDGNKIKYLDAGTPVRVEGRWCDDKSRAAVTDKAGDFGTVIKRGLKKVTAATEKTESAKPVRSGESYYAVIRYKLNMRDASGKLMQEVPRGAMVKVIGDDKANRDRCWIDYGGKEGTVLDEGVKKVKDAVFVSIGSQKVTLIRGGKLIGTSKCVTGTRAKEDTPKGMFKITQKHTNKVFRPSGKVSLYWMRFCGGCGFHDARWRSSWGSGQYKKSGSNGCVNLPLSFAKTLYNNAYVGMPVYIS